MINGLLNINAKTICQSQQLLYENFYKDLKSSNYIRLFNIKKNKFSRGF